MISLQPANADDYGEMINTLIIVSITTIRLELFFSLFSYEFPPSDGGVRSAAVASAGNGESYATQSIVKMKLNQWYTRERQDTIEWMV